METGVQLGGDSYVMWLPIRKPSRKLIKIQKEKREEIQQQNISRRRWLFNVNVVVVVVVVVVVDDDVAVISQL